jgi:hypothetical protein
LGLLSNTIKGEPSFLASCSSRNLWTPEFRVCLSPCPRLVLTLVLSSPRPVLALVLGLFPLPSLASTLAPPRTVTTRFSDVVRWSLSVGWYVGLLCSCLSVSLLKLCTNMTVMCWQCSDGELRPLSNLLCLWVSCCNLFPVLDDRPRHFLGHCLRRCLRHFLGHFLRRCLRHFLRHCLRKSLRQPFADQGGGF